MIPTTMNQSSFTNLTSPRLLAVAIAGCALAYCTQRAAAAETAENTAAVYQSEVQKGIDFLRTSQAADGSFSSAGVGPGVTAIVVAAVLRNGRGIDDPLVAKALKYLEGTIQPDGGIYAPKSRLKNYETCLAVLCLKEANRDGRYDQAIKNADRFLKGLQAGDDVQPSDIAYGGVGYGGPDRPDLSNTHFLMDALEASGNGPDDEAVKRALVFVSRCQNLETEHNTTAFAAKNPDGGFYYTPVGEGGSPAGKTDQGGLRSYGSMSYAALKSMIFAGLKPDDPRVKAALDWAHKHYTLSENPGLGEGGLYYYLHLLAKALEAVGQPKFADSQGKDHDWRAELITELAKRQQPNGSWVNTNTRWMEGDPNLVTGYALLTLSYCRPQAK